MRDENLLTFSKKVFKIPSGLKFWVFKMDWTRNGTWDLKKTTQKTNLHESNKQVKCKFSCIKMVVKLFYNPYQALKSNIIIRTLIKDKHITLPILMLYNFQNKKNKPTLSFEIISTRNCLLRMVCHLIGPIWLKERNLMLESW